MFFAQAAIVAIHVLVAVIVIRVALHERIVSMSRFERDVMAGRYGIADFVSVEDDRKGFRREMIEGLTDHARFTFLTIYDNRNGLSEFNLRVNDQYYGSWFVREQGRTRLARLYRILRPQPE